MDKMRMESVNITEQNIEKIGALFPNAITEKMGADGKIRKAIDFDVLRQMLTEEAIAGDEAYEFTWVGKKAAMVEASRPIRKTLRPCPEESKDWDTTQNLYIEGDNLDVLKLLQESYLGKVKMIYIDPPYNTGHDFIYRDKFAHSQEEEETQMGMFDEETGERLFENTESNGRFHSDWCNMIYPRLMLSRNLLSEDGAIFISIDDHEADNLKKICDEVFGATCFVANVSWQRTYSIRNDSKGVPAEVEHLIIYSKSSNWEPKKLPRTAEMDSAYSNPDGDVCAWMSGSPVASEAATHQGMVYAIQHPFTGEMIYPSDTAHWRYSQDQMLEYMRGWCGYTLKDINDAERRAKVCGISVDTIKKDVKAIVLSGTLEESKKKAEEVYKKGPWPRFYFTSGGKGGIRRKVYLDSVGGRIATNYWPYDEVGHTDEAKKEIKNLFGGSAPFDTPKPTRLIERILAIATNKDSLVLDFFGGSSTTAHAVYKANAADGGSRKCITVQIPETCNKANYHTVSDIGKERIRLAGQKILTELASGHGRGDGSGYGMGIDNVKEYEQLTGEKVLDIGFRVLKLDDSNMKDVYYGAGEYTQTMLTDMISNIKEDRTPLDLLFGCLLEWGLPLSLPYTSEEIDGFTVHTYNEGDLVACFDADISEKVVREIAKRQPLRVVFRDSSFATSPARINVEEIFKLLAPNTSVKVL